jgi:hypothetical protein
MAHNGSCEGLHGLMKTPTLMALPRRYGFSELRLDHMQRLRSSSAVCLRI